MGGRLTTLILVLSLLQCVSMVTIRDVIEAKLATGPNLATWETDVALASIMSSKRNVKISEEEAHNLYEMLKFVPRSPPSGVFSILEKRGGFDFDAILDYDIEEIISELNLQCDEELKCKASEGILSLFSNDTDSDEAYAECTKDLNQLLAPVPGLALNYVKSAVTKTKADLNCCFICRLALGVALDKIEDLIPKEEKKMPAWGWKIVDAMAKPPTGIMGGQLQWVGSYEMCNKIDTSYTIEVNDTHNMTRPIRGKYCRVMIGMVNSSSALLRLGFGMCFPHTCTKDGVMDHLMGKPGLIGQVLGLIGLEVKEVFCGHVLDYPTDTRAQIAISIIATLIVIALLASIYDGLIRKEWLKSWVKKDQTFQPQMTKIGNGVVQKEVPTVTQPYSGIRRQSSLASNIGLLSSLSYEGDYVLEEKPTILLRLETIFAGFSVLTSFRKVCDVTHLGKHHLPTADAVRFLSLVYAIGGNTFLFGIIYTESITSSNLVAKMLELPHLLIFQPIINFSFTADSFLVVSGIMISYHWLRRLKKADGQLKFKQIVHYYIHRYWSLMPMMMLTIMLYACLYKYLVAGPIIPKQITDAENCKVNWWANLLMIGNLANTDAMCLAWTWYAPMLFQLQVISPIILIPLSIRRWAGWLALAILYVIYLSTVSGVVNEQVYVPNQDFASWYYDYLLTPWCRAGPYYIGIAVGILLSDKERIKEKIPKNCVTKLIALCMWLLALLVVTSLTFGTYGKNKKEDPVKWTRDQSVAHDVLARSAWGLAIGWMIFACETGFGGVVQSILSYACFTPVSRLSYPVFIIHAIFIFRYAYSQFDPIYITFPNMLYVYFGHIFTIYIIGFLLALIFFFPFRGMEEAFCAKTKFDIALAASHPKDMEEMRVLDENIYEDMIDYPQVNAENHNYQDIHNSKKKDPTTTL